MFLELYFKKLDVFDDSMCSELRNNSNVSYNHSNWDSSGFTTVQCSFLFNTNYFIKKCLLSNSNLGNEVISG